MGKPKQYPTEKHQGSHPNVKHKGSRLTYAFWAGILAGIPLVCIYHYGGIRAMPWGIDKWIVLFIAVFLTGIIGSWAARWITHYGKFEFNGQFILTNVIASAFFTTIIWSGLLGFLMDTQPIPQLVVWYVIIRVLIFFGSEFLADKITFGR